MKLDVTFEQTTNKLTADFGEVKEVSDGGYERGYAQGVTEGEKQGYTKGYTDGESKGYEQGYEQGNSVYYANQLPYYARVVFPENFDLVLRMKELTNDTYQNFYLAENLKRVKIVTDNKEAPLGLNQAFRECPSIEVVDLTECSRKISRLDYCFFQCSNLISIFGALDLSELTDTASLGFLADSIRDIEFVPNTIKKSIRFTSYQFTDASIESIINGLADLTGSTTQTLTLNRIGAKLTEEQRARITAKNWTLVA